MAEPLLHDLWVDTLLEGERRPRVAQPVDRQAGESVARYATEERVAHRVRSEPRAVRLMEHETEALLREQGHDRNLLIAVMRILRDRDALRVTTSAKVWMTWLRVAPFPSPELLEENARCHPRRLIWVRYAGEGADVVICYRPAPTRMGASPVVARVRA